MRISRIYTDQTLQTGDEISLDTASSRYLVSVLRLSVGAPIILFNGQGGEFHAKLQHCQAKKVTVSIESYDDTERESPLNTHLAIGISRGDRMDWIVQKATELGVTHITPILTERTEVKLKGDRGDKKLRHWQQIAVSTCEQCQRNRIPQIDSPISLAEFLAQDIDALKLVLHHRSEQSLAELGRETVSSVVLLVGPEGGLSETEIDSALISGYQALTIGPRVLRTETAPLTALTLCQSLWGDFF
ncbi:MAG: 16S rRNA (uracil(1498)-N(3))-methyltransferase [Pseudomonadales bacterium]